ncbi:DUF2062 domain-containing protein [Proteinivorax hydrogeniformans]|uniref:DUF2062 domain-containing protein n=1 Tax=Proteinivorax hydrogeniformans TaxID=1826727 RepID=A0AAU8HSQ4_9FIRM
MKEKIINLWKKLSQISDTPHAIALGAALGLGWNFIPSLGIGPFMSIFSAKIFKASGIAAVTINLGTGFFIPVLYTLNMVTGRFILGDFLSFMDMEEELSNSMQSSLDGIEAVTNTPSSFFSLDTVTEMGAEFFLGGFINAAIFGLILYGLIWTPPFIKGKIQRKT